MLPVIMTLGCIIAKIWGGRSCYTLLYITVVKKWFGSEVLICPVNNINVIYQGESIDETKGESFICDKIKNITKKLNT
jgi:hypothetical protein